MGKPEGFYRRLKQVCDDSKTIPEYGKGRQVFLARRLKVTQEAVRKWFAGQARPNVKKMSQLADLLEVDEAWLSLGITPVLEPRERRSLSDKSEGAAYLLFGMFTLAGGHCAFRSEASGSSDVDFYAITHGVQIAVHATPGREVSPDTYEFIIPRDYRNMRCYGVVRNSGMTFHVIALRRDLIDKHAARRAGGFAVAMGYTKGNYMTGSDVWQRVKHLEDL